MMIILLILQMAMVKGGGAIPGLGAPAGIENITETKVQFICTDDQQVSAFLLTSLGILGITANIILISVICCRRAFKRCNKADEDDYCIFLTTLVGVMVSYFIKQWWTLLGQQS